MPTRRRYSSVDGCCICGTNSSIEPFVKSDKVSQSQKSLDNIFKNCFELDEKRNGEWCTSCKEIAKKWLRTSKARRNSTSFKKVNFIGLTSFPSGGQSTGLNARLDITVGEVSFLMLGTGVEEFSG